MPTDDEPASRSQLDDTALLDWRVKTRAELETLPPRSTEHAALSAMYESSLDELVERARTAWAKTS
jgi:hypothetical protein